MKRIQNDITRPLIDRIMCRVQKDKDTGCWNWTGAKYPVGNVFRPRMNHNGRLRMVYTILYELWNGPIPKGKMSCHKCDNSLCVNPAHIYPGTALENAHDAISKGRTFWQKDPTGFSAMRSKANQKRAYSNRTGMRGVYRHKSGRFWSEIKLFGKRHHLGTFDSAEAAHKAFLKAKESINK